ncbi:DUF1592 domain-containing protein [Polyangium sp. y55x31]|uniref:DUF1592 domain-containing protein n=1 Tax=Polyangium sp. y55x31 TaxID=3042688 RepID=UPI002482A25C|nr:DUF1592 domain-containing protein [Polyangium sp. y55x31]MDI1480939.1 DUF1592 domain-containing protein [Polyangium sp. y55x31]
MTHAVRLPWLLGGALALCAAAPLAACSGHIGDPPGEDTGEAPAFQCVGTIPGKSPIRRMTRFEYNNTVRDLVGDDTRPASAFVPEEEAMGFDNQATALGVTQILAEQYMVAAEQIAARAASDLGALLPCDPATAGEQACATTFIQTFGRRAYRRPLTDDEVSRLQDVFSWGRGDEGFPKGIELVLQVMLQSPHFLYRVEFGMPDPVEADVVPLSHHEMASRLSYMLWGTMPDEALFAAADEGRLGTKEEIAKEARRMLDDPRAREAVANFNAQWLGLSHLDNIKKDSSTYPKYYEGIRPLWRAETLAFLEDVIFEGQGDIGSVFTANYSMLNAELASFYGVEDGPATQSFERVELDPTKTSGILTHASVLAATGKPNQTSPVHRGKFVRERLLCQILPPPPNNAAFNAPDVRPDATTRERFAEHSENPACAGCHIKMDPVGFGFEHYDGIGLYRDTDQGLPIDDSGELVDTRGIDGPFEGVVELGQRLAQSEEARQCVATQWFRFAYGRVEGEDDRCSMSEIQQAFAASGFNVKELLVALTQTDAFRYRRAVVTQAP